MYQTSVNRPMPFPQCKFDAVWMRPGAIFQTRLGFLIQKDIHTTQMHSMSNKYNTYIYTCTIYGSVFEERPGTEVLRLGQSEWHSFVNLGSFTHAQVAVRSTCMATASSIRQANCS